MASAQNDKLVILRGDDTGGAFGRPLAFTIEAAEGVSLEGCRAEWIFEGIVKAIDAPLVPGEVREIFYSHNETRRMALGVRYGTFRIIDAAGKVRTFTNTKAVEVTDNVARCYPGSSSATVHIGTTVTWEQVSGKPLLVKTINGEAPDASGNIAIAIGGDVKHADFEDIEEKEGMTLKEVGAMVNTLVRKLKGTVAAFAALLALGALADVPLSPDMDFGDISPTNKLKEVVEASGAISGIDTNAVIDIANATIATNHVIAAKLDGPAVAPTNMADYAGKAADAKLTGIELTNRYTKAETDAKLAGKVSLFPMGERPEELEDGDVYVKGLVFGEVDVMCGTYAGGFHSLMNKANRPEDFDQSHAGNLASLTADGDLADSGIAKTNVATKADLSAKAGLREGKLSTADHYVTAGDILYEGDSPYNGSIADKLTDVDNYKANKKSDAVQGNLASFDSGGDIEDSGIAADDVATKTEMSDTYLPLTGGNLSGDLSSERGWSLTSDGLGINSGTIYPYGNTTVGAPMIANLGSGFTLFHSDEIPDNPTWHYGSSLSADNEIAVKGDIPVISATDPTFSNAVMSVATGISTNDWAVIASVADWASVIPGGVPTGAGTLGAVLAALAAAVLALKKKTSLLKSDGTAEDDFATNLLGKQVAKIPLEIVAETATEIDAVEGHAYSVTMPAGGITINFPTVPQGTTRAWIFQCRFANSGSANANVSFNPSGSVIKFDGTDCGIVKAGKDALLSAMWNGEAWDLVWKNQA